MRNSNFTLQLLYLFNILLLVSLVDSSQNGTIIACSIDSTPLITSFNFEV